METVTRYELILKLKDRSGYRHDDPGRLVRVDRVIGCLLLRSHKTRQQQRRRKQQALSGSIVDSADCDVSSLTPATL